MLARGGCQPLTLRPAIDQAADALEIAARHALLDIDAEPLALPERHQAVPAAVAHVEADARALPVHHGEGLAVFQIAERELAIRATQPLGESDAKRSTAKDELPHGPDGKKAVCARPFLVVQQGEGVCLALRIGREIHVEDGHAPGFAPRPPPSSPCHGHDSGARGGKRVEVHGLFRHRLRSASPIMPV